MAGIIHETFGRLAPVLKARTLIRHRVNGTLPCSAANMETVADSLALGWLDEHVRLQRAGVSYLKNAEGALEEVISFVRQIVKENEVENKSALLLFTMLDGVRADVREAVTRIALAGVAVAVVAMTFSTTDDLAKRMGGRRLARRRHEAVALVCPETGGVL